PLGVLKAAPLPPIRITQKIKPIKISHPKKDVTIFDFGQNFAGWLKLKINAPAGTKINLRYGELLYDDGQLNPMTSVCGQIKGKKNEGSPIGGPGSPEIACQQDTYIAKGTGSEYYCPTFTFHGFRYVEIIGHANPLTASDIIGLRLNTDIEKVGQFSCSNDLFNKIQKNTEWTFLSNIFSVQSDCPHRERFGYGGDIAVTTDAFIMNYNMAQFYANTVSLFTDSALDGQVLTSTAPFVAINCGPVWEMAHPLLQSQLYRYYGNKTIIQQNYKISKRWLDNLTKQYPSHIIEKGLSDHESLEETPAPQLVTPLYYQSTKILEKLASIVGEYDQAQQYNKLAEDIRVAYLKNFNDPQTGTFDPCTQTSQSFAIYLNLVPEKQTSLAVNALLKNIQQKDNHLTTGIFGTKYMLEALSRTGHADIAYNIVNQKTPPSWGYMIEKGATTLWEHWDFSDNTFSHNHPMFGSVSEWFYRWLGGIQPADDAIAFDKIIIRPQIIPNLNWVNSSHKSIRGLIVSNWSINKNSLKMQIEIPANTSATVYIPAAKLDEIKENSTPVSQLTDIKLVNFDKNTAIFEIGSGKYNFESQITPESLFSH
ncbi:MAG TPA: family 78 glycoside hydrolase catalytic domain, partial [Sedimentisphaerales bacterium]|nr:family 78 glycoside hydrolase catalytic domain [Sedimentisphaerales bacterium]